MTNVKEITATELKEKIEKQENFELIDVREEEEVEFAAVEPFTHIPLGSLGSKLAMFSPDKEYVLICRSGRRSDTACRFLMEKGISKVYNLSGGIIAWASEVDPSMQVL